MRFNSNYYHFCCSDDCLVNDVLEKVVLFYHINLFTLWCKYLGVQNLIKSSIYHLQGYITDFVNKETIIATMFCGRCSGINSYAVVSNGELQFWHFSVLKRTLPPFSCQNKSLNKDVVFFCSAMSRSTA